MPFQVRHLVKRNVVFLFLVIASTIASVDARGPDASGQNRALDRAARTEFRERSVHSIVDRWQARCRHTAESALWRNCFAGTAHDRGARTTEHAIAPTHFDPADS